VARRAEPSEQEAQATAAQGDGDENAELRARVAELEQRLGQRVMEMEQEGPQVSPVMRELYDAAIQDLPQLAECDEARVASMAKNTMVLDPGEDPSKRMSIYRRKYEVMGKALTQQEDYMRAFRRVVKAAKSSKVLEDIIELYKKGGRGLSKKQVRADMDLLMQESRLATLLFRDVVPEVLDNPIANAITGVIATIGIVILTLLFCFCFFPPIPPQE